MTAEDIIIKSRNDLISLLKENLDISTQGWFKHVSKATNHLKQAVEELENEQSNNPM